MCFADEVLLIVAVDAELSHGRPGMLTFTYEMLV